MIVVSDRHDVVIHLVLTVFSKIAIHRISISLKHPSFLRKFPPIFLYYNSCSNEEARSRILKEQISVVKIVIIFIARENTEQYERILLRLYRYNKQL